jgi:hypothetical protein
MGTLDALTALATATDFEVVEVFKVFANRLGTEVKRSRAEFIADLPAELRSVDSADVVAGFEAAADHTVTGTTAAAAARRLLALAAGDENTATLVTDSFDGWQDDSQLVDLVLSVGLVGSVWMVLASTTVVVKGGKITVEKSVNAPEQLKAFAEVIRALRGDKGKQKAS